MMRIALDELKKLNVAELRKLKAEAEQKSARQEKQVFPERLAAFKASLAPLEQSDNESLLQLYPQLSALAKDQAFADSFREETEEKLKLIGDIYGSHGIIDSSAGVLAQFCGYFSEVRARENPTLSDVMQRFELLDRSFRESKVDPDPSLLTLYKVAEHKIDDPLSKQETVSRDIQDTMAVVSRYVDSANKRSHAKVMAADEAVNERMKELRSMPDLRAVLKRRQALKESLKRMAEQLGEIDALRTKQKNSAAAQASDDDFAMLEKQQKELDTLKKALENVSPDDTTPDVIAKKQRVNTLHRQIYPDSQLVYQDVSPDDLEVKEEKEDVVDQWPRQWNQACELLAALPMGLDELETECKTLNTILLDICNKYKIHATEANQEKANQVVAIEISIFGEEIYEKSQLFKPGTKELDMDACVELQRRLEAKEIAMEDLPQETYVIYRELSQEGIKKYKAYKDLEATLTDPRQDPLSQIENFYKLASRDDIKKIVDPNQQGFLREVTIGLPKNILKSLVSIIPGVIALVGWFVDNKVSRSCQDFLRNMWFSEGHLMRARAKDKVKDSGLLLLGDSSPATPSQDDTHDFKHEKRR